MKKPISSFLLLLFSSLLLQAQNVGIGNTNPTARLHVTGMVKIDGLNVLEFGADIAGTIIRMEKTLLWNGFPAGISA